MSEKVRDRIINANIMAFKTTRTRLAIHEKKEMAEYCIEHPKVNNCAVSRLFTEKLGKLVTRFHVFKLRKNIDVFQSQRSDVRGGSVFPENAILCYSGTTQIFVIKLESCTKRISVY